MPASMELNSQRTPRLSVMPAHAEILRIIQVVMFPAQVGGWHKRQASNGLNATNLREVPLRMGFNTGIPGAPISSDLLEVPGFKETSLRRLLRYGGIALPRP